MRLQVALLALRLGVFVVMLVWTLDKFIQPQHSAAVFEGFYFLSGIGPTALAVIAGIELVVIVAFVAGAVKRLSYGAVLVLHGVSTFASFRQYLDPFNNLLFFAAWPMLAACLALYLLRDEDTLWTLPRAG